MDQLAQRYTPDELRVCKEGTAYSSGPNRHAHTPIYSQKNSRPHVFFHLKRFEIFPQTCIFTHKNRTKYPSHTLIWATRVNIYTLAVFSLPLLAEQAKL